MKKLSIFLTLVLILGLGRAFVYADSPVINKLSWHRHQEFRDQDSKEWHRDKMEWRREDIEKRVTEGYLTEEEAKNWEEHFDYMEEFHRENGYRGCHGGSMMRGNTPRGHGRRGRMSW